jgi:hypothetical protein
MDLESRMSAFVKKLGLPLEVEYFPDPDSPRHGEIKDNVILIYDPDEEAAWHTLLHETTEHRLKGLTSTYRRVINKLIEALEEEIYSRKESILNQVLSDFCTWKELEDSLAPTKQKQKQRRKNINGTFSLH